ncbi:MAG: 6-phosphofructokinase [Vallitaleaceae bacterium]|nr:6-phosphofructokinase [Vallitaleaceae bacterium]
MSNCIIAQSGGPTAVINASLAGVIEAALSNSSIQKIYGSINGIVGILEENIMELNDIFSNDVNNLELLKNTPGMYLGSCRFKLKKVEADDSQYKKIFSVFEKYGVKYFFYIGGNDSMDTVHKLSLYAAKNNIDIQIMGIPKTIDNDLFGTDHTPGFGSAAKFVATTLLEIAHDSYIYDMESVTIVEIMGRHAGWLTAAASLARTYYSDAPDLIYLPEVPFSAEQFLSDIKEVQSRKKNVIIAVSEGVKDANGEFLTASTAAKDSFGHVQLSGTGKALETLVAVQLGCKARSVELSVLQRSAMHIASQTDVEEATKVGQKAVEFAVNGYTGKMVCMNRVNENPYTIEIGCIDIGGVANEEKIIPRDWINAAGNDVTSDMLDYLRPLITGQPALPFANGVPKYLDISHLSKKTV